MPGNNRSSPPVTENVLKGELSLWFWQVNGRIRQEQNQGFKTLVAICNKRTQAGQLNGCLPISTACDVLSTSA